MGPSRVFSHAGPAFVICYLTFGPGPFGRSSRGDTATRSPTTTRWRGLEAPGLQGRGYGVGPADHETQPWVQAKNPVPTKWAPKGRGGPVAQPATRGLRHLDGRLRVGKDPERAEELYWGGRVFGAARLGPGAAWELVAGLSHCPRQGGHATTSGHCLELRSAPRGAGPPPIATLPDGAAQGEQLRAFVLGLDPFGHQLEPQGSGQGHRG